jgi:formylglycine-generating enzyme required for sulfatase activity
MKSNSKQNQTPGVLSLSLLLSLIPASIPAQGLSSTQSVTTVGGYTKQSSPLEQLKRADAYVKIQPGEFLMGANSDQPDEKPVHRVRITLGFEMGKYEVTQAQWEAVMGGNPSHFKGADLPVENVSWDDVQNFLLRLNEKSLDYLYRLPTEAEWEYACRAGTTGDYAGGVDSLAWYRNNSGNTTHTVGQKSPNAWGLYDMHGNVWEWCQDWYEAYASAEAVDPKGASTGAARVLRGGSWTRPAASLHSARRSGFSSGTRNNSLGFRLVRTRR